MAESSHGTAISTAWSPVTTGSIVPLSFNVSHTGRAPGGYTVYKLSYEEKVTLPHGEVVYNTYELWKRYTEFQQLFKQLEESHRQARSHDQLPRLLKAGYLDRFKESVIEERKASVIEVLGFASTQSHFTPLLTAFTEGAVKLTSAPYQRTPVQPTTTYIEKPSDSVPLSAMMPPETNKSSGESPIAAGVIPDSTAPANKRESPTVPGDFPNDSDSSDGEPDLTINPVSTDAPATQKSATHISADSWWKEAMEVTDGIDNLVEGLDNHSKEIKGSRSPSPRRARRESDYIRQAGKLITSALSSEANGDYGEAFSLLKAGVDLLLNGVQNDSSKRRREIVSQKTAQYLQHAESLHQKHLVPPPVAKPHLLPDFRVVEVIDKVMVVESRMSGQRFAIKTLHKSLSARTRSSVNRAPGVCKHTVRLLHHYETANQRIFLLLEYHKRGRLIDHVDSKRTQWRRLTEAALNPHPESSLIKRDNTSDDMERMLSELTAIVPPSHSLPLTDTTITSDSTDTSDPVDTTDINDSTDICDPVDTTDINDSADTSDPVDTTDINDSADTSDPASDPSPSEEDSLDVLKRRLEEAVSVSVEPPTPTADQAPPLGTESPKKSPAYSPASRGSPEPNSKVDDWVLRLEENVRSWAAQVILGLEHLHNQGVIVRDLHPGNILLTDSGRAVLTYIGNWDFVERRSKQELDMYVAPEAKGLGEATPTSDWWSLGAILFQLLTGQSLLACHPDGISTHLPLRLPVSLSPEATLLLTQLLQVEPRERLGSGMTGVEELRSHSFFSGVNWQLL